MKIGRGAEFLPTYYEKRTRCVASDFSVPKSHQILNGTFPPLQATLHVDSPFQCWSLFTICVNEASRIYTTDQPRWPCAQSSKFYVRIWNDISPGNSCDLSKLEENMWIYCTDLGGPIAKLLLESWEKKLEQGIKKAGWHGVRTLI